MTEPETTGNIEPHPSSTHAHNHRWDNANEKRVLPDESKDGLERCERVCLNCGMTKITVHYPQGWPKREWRTHDGKPWWGSSTPPCVQRVRG